jgi:hypothetical protein
MSAADDPRPGVPARSAASVKAALASANAEIIDRCVLLAALLSTAFDHNRPNDTTTDRLVSCPDGIRARLQGSFEQHAWAVLSARLSRADSLPLSSLAINLISDPLSIQEQMLLLFSWDGRHILVGHHRLAYAREHSGQHRRLPVFIRRRRDDRIRAGRVP